MKSFLISHPVLWLTPKIQDTILNHNVHYVVRKVPLRCSAFFISFNCSNLFRNAT
jgi:hypothetical protein